jgi:cytochrome P450
MVEWMPSRRAPLENFMLPMIEHTFAVFAYRSTRFPNSDPLDRIADDPGLIPAAVEETLRFDPSVPVWRRVTTRPAQLGGVELPKGAKLFLWLAATGRDPSVFPDPDGFDLGRPNADRHLAFGLGLHYCLGASLGKLEARLALEELTARFPRLRLVEGQALSFHPNISFRGPQALWVRCT